MISGAAIEAGVASAILRAALAGWIALFVLKLIDHRKSIAPFGILLGFITLTASVRGALLSTFDETWQVTTVTTTQTIAIVAAWWSSSLLAAVVLASQLRRWVRTAPEELHREASSTDPRKRQKTKRSRDKAVGHSAPSGPLLSLGLCLLGATLIVVALLLGDVDMARLSGAAWWISITHLLLSACLLGMAICCALELSFLSSPDALNPTSGVRVAWKCMDRLAIILAAIELSLCCAVFFMISNGPNLDVKSAALAGSYAFTLLVVAYVVWMIPHRVAHFQTHGKPRGWVALALAAWLVFFALLVVSALPPTWPWRDIVAGTLRVPSASYYEPLKDLPRRRQGPTRGGGLPAPRIARLDRFAILG
ncbi:MAG: hypothetical protein R3C53_03295 [Pirellulaceae bacterium]